MLPEAVYPLRRRRDRDPPVAGRLKVSGLAEKPVDWACSYTWKNLVLGNLKASVRSRSVNTCAEALVVGEKQKRAHPQEKSINKLPIGNLWEQRKVKKI